MRLLAAPLIVLAATLHVAAAPIRVIVFNHAESSMPPEHNNLVHILPISHPAPALEHAKPVHMMPPTVHISSTTQRRPGCAGMRGKAIEATNAFRHMLGLPIVAMPHEAHAHDVAVRPIDVSARPLVAQSRPQHMHHMYHQGEGPSFLRRVHFALMALGPWEGRAVAFVLGCGIGVLLRMIWVMALVTARAIRGPRPEDEYEPVIVFDQDAEPENPPQYTAEVHNAPVADEKTPVA